MFPRCKSGNTIAFAATGERIDLSLEELRKRALVFEERTALALLLALRKLDNSPAFQEGKLTL